MPLSPFAPQIPAVLVGFLLTPCNSRPGYRGTDIPVKSPKQWRIDTVPGHEHRVWVAPGVKCNTLCTNSFGTIPCSEVPVRDACAPFEYDITVNPGDVSDRSSSL